MLNFIYQIPMKIIFSKETIHDLSKEVRRYGKKVFMVYGGHSSFEIGLYEIITRQFKDTGIVYQELGHVTEPSLSLLYQGIKKARVLQADLILGVGGGGRIDMAKVIAVGVRWTAIMRSIVWIPENMVVLVVL